MSEQDAHILDRCDQIILDSLSPEPPPACAFEVMIVGRVGKTMLDQTPSLAVTPHGSAVSLSAGHISYRLFFVSLHGTRCDTRDTSRARARDRL